MKPTSKSDGPVDFNLMTLRLASPDRIREWSFGEVVKPETINYRTQRSERGGLFDEKIFGPERDFECYCGKYRGIRYKGIVCEKCGVEITRSIVRRERMGHIELASPVAHIWFLKGVPSRIALLLGVTSADLEKVVYFAGYIVTNVSEDERARILRDLDSEYKSKLKQMNDGKTKEKLKESYLAAKKEIAAIQEGKVLEDALYGKYAMKYGSLFEAEIGAEAVHGIFKKLDLNVLAEKLEEQLLKASAVEREKANKRLSLVRAMLASGVRPEWMFLTALPVIPPAIRPMVALEGGRHASSDVNDLYRRVINRNNRLTKLKEINAPAVILRNEKRILQEAVDALIDNSIRHGSASFASVSQANRRPLKSLADNLKGKQGLFRANLLGKRVDYSGRSVIVVGPSLKLDECGLPKHMALELFRPFVIGKLLEREIAYNIRGAGKLIDDAIPEVWAILEEVIEDKYILLNRAPTLHRLGIQAFKPRLIEGNAIQVHPLVCTAFNADFDGDQMAVHVPLSEEAQMEAREIIASDKNILKPGNGEPTLSAKLLDIILGCYWVTKEVPGEKGEGKIFESPNSAISAADYGEVSLRAKVTVLGTDTPKYAAFEGKPFETTAGRLLFNAVLPKDYPYVNAEIRLKRLGALVNDIIELHGIDAVPDILDRVKNFGFRYATKSGTTWGLDDIKVPEGKLAVVEAGRRRVETVLEQWNDGLLSEEEKARKSIEIWTDVKMQVEKLIPDTLEENSSVHDMLNSGARGSMGQITIMAGMKGLVQNIANQTVEFPILSSSMEGLTPIEYFTTTHGSRKGLADTALNTARAGYLTRRLFDVAQDAIITEEDCGGKEGIVMSGENAAGIEIPLSKNIRGRFLAEDVAADDGTVLFPKGHFLTKHDAQEIENKGIKAVTVRSPLSCKSIQGICQRCYGLDLGKNKLVDLGEAVGTVAAQAIGEPGTQLTMRTFHAGGVAGVDITSGLPRVEEIFDKRIPKNAAVVASVDGTVTDIKDTGKEKIITVLADEGEKVKGGKKEIEYSAYVRRTPFVKVGDHVKKGDLITDGSADIEEVFKYGGRAAAEAYIISEVNKIYELQGSSFSRKHMEVIIRQMFSRRKIKDAGDTGFSVGDIVEYSEFQKENKRTKEAGGEEAKGELLVRGITEVALTRKSFLSASSFQNTTRILINSAIRGAEDPMTGLKENVLIGRLIPAGTGFPGSPKQAMVKQLQDEIAAASRWEERE
jgi:DNA-directed RNA polymerase subunit beta'